MYPLIKRLLDILLSATALVVLALPMLLIALAVRLDSKGPAIFRQKRMGRNLVPFTCYKFRTMSMEAPPLTKNTKRVDTISRFSCFFVVSVMI